MVKSKSNGYDIEFIESEWIYSDNKISLSVARPCNNCGKHTIKDGKEEYDSCIGRLPGVKNACCGHGNIYETYVQLLDNTLIKGADAKILQDILKKYRTK